MPFEGGKRAHLHGLLYNIKIAFSFFQNVPKRYLNGILSNKLLESQDTIESSSRL